MLTVSQALKQIECVAQWPVPMQNKTHKPYVSRPKPYISRQLCSTKALKQTDRMAKWPAAQ